MYRLLCENLHDFIQETYGEDVWKLARESAGVNFHSFVTHQVYSKSVIPSVTKAASELTGTPHEELMNSWGVYFLGFVGKYGYDRIVKVLGRHVCDSVNGLDNLHDEYLRLSYPKVQPSTFFCQEVSATGVTLHCRSTRTGYLHYAVGQLRRMGKQFYDSVIQVEVLSEEMVGDYSHVAMRTESLTAMFKTGLCIIDLSLHDSSRDPVLAGTQQSKELKRALMIQEQKESSELEETMQMLGREMKKTDDLLYRMIPRPEAERLCKGEPAVNTREVLPDVTVLFSDMVGFTRFCSHLTPMQVVSMLNTMYTLFDMLSDKPCVFKVETIGDAYMVVVAGAPEKTKYHAYKICDMAVDMIHSIGPLRNPFDGSNIHIHVGIHSGMVVGGVVVPLVGHKRPRYSLHGDTVHPAAAMESSGKGNVEMETYWLLKGKRDPVVNAQADPEASGDKKGQVSSMVAEEFNVVPIPSHASRPDGVFGPYYGDFVL